MENSTSHETPLGPAAHIPVKFAPREATTKRNAPVAALRGTQSFLTWGFHAFALNASFPVVYSGTANDR
jgi:hypothetical protein